jgi:hypothetical protein
VGRPKTSKLFQKVPKLANFERLASLLYERYTADPIRLRPQQPERERMDGLGSAKVVLFEGFRLDLTGGGLPPPPRSQFRPIPLTFRP